MFKIVIVLGTLLSSVRLCSQMSISRANGDRRSQNFLISGVSNDVFCKISALMSK